MAEPPPPERAEGQATAGGGSSVPPTIDSVRRAAERLGPILRPTPAGFSDSLTARAGRGVWLKPEQRQRTGSFKIRGAYNLQAQLPAGSPVVAASAGNHAQGVALAASMLGQRATIFMPSGASLPKVQATTAYGAEVLLDGSTVDDCVVAAERFAAETGAVFVPPFDHPEIVAGQGTVGLELCAEVAGLSSVLLAVGGGGLCAGVALAVKALRPEVTVVGVAAGGAASIVASLAEGHPVEVEPRTIADGVALRSPSPLTLSMIAAHVDHVVTVTDEQISQAVLAAVERAKAVVEPAGAVALAGLLSAPEVPELIGPGPTAVVLGGGNVDPMLLGRIIEHGLSVAGRYLVMNVVVEDRPGSLAALTDEVARLGLNVTDVEHHRSGIRLAVGEVEVQVTVETRDRDHRLEVLSQLTDRGYDVRMIE